MKRIRITFLLISFVATFRIASGIDVPYLSGRVNDYANTFSEETRKSLAEKLKEHETKTTDQVVILTDPSLEGESIEDFANRVFNEWKLGQKDKNNGILIVVVPDERRMRIEVGYGLEGTMTDILAGRVIQNIIAPRFREGDFDAGITDGALAVIGILEGNAPEGDEETREALNVTSGSGFNELENTDMPITMRILLGAFIFGIIGLFTVIGILTPGVGWFLYLFLIPFWAMFPIVVVGTKGALILFITYMVVYPAAKLYLKNAPWYKKAKEDLKTKGQAKIGGFMVTSGGSGGSGGSWSSGGGFSGGGGSSGGGGASGGW